MTSKILVFIFGIVGTVVIILFISIAFTRYQTKLENEQIAEDFKENIMNFSAEEIIRYHNDFIISRNFDGIILIYRSIGCDRRSWRNEVRNFIKSEIVSIEEIVDEAKVYSLFSTAISDFYEVSFFAVEIEIERREQWGYPDGIVGFIYTVVRETPEAPWSIFIITRDILKITEWHIGMKVWKLSLSALIE